MLSFQPHEDIMIQLLVKAEAVGEISLPMTTLRMAQGLRARVYAFTKKLTKLGNTDRDAKAWAERLGVISMHIGPVDGAGKCTLLFRRKDHDPGLLLAAEALRALGPVKTAEELEAEASLERIQRLVQEQQEEPKPVEPSPEVAARVNKYLGR